MVSLIYMFPDLKKQLQQYVSQEQKYIKYRMKFEENIYYGEFQAQRSLIRR